MTRQIILIVDEDKDLVRLLKEGLLQLNKNYQIRVSHNGSDALEILESEPVDIMMLNLQIPDLGGRRILSELQGKGLWLPVVVLSPADTDQNAREFLDFGVVDFLNKPFIPEKAIVDIDDLLKKRQRADLIKNFGLPAIMQLIEMEKRTGIITIKVGNKDAHIFFKGGKLMDIAIKGLSSGEALQACMNSLYEDREICIEYIEHRRDKKIDMSLMEFVMESSRISDEREVRSRQGDAAGKKEENRRNDDISALSALLNSLKEVESYILSTDQGEFLLSSSTDYNEDILNSSIYLWVIGQRLKDKLNLPNPTGLVYNRKNKKRIIRKYKDYVMILDITDITKFSSFKSKLDELLHKIAGV